MNLKSWVTWSYAYWICSVILELVFLQSISSWLQKNFKFTILRLLANTIVKQKFNLFIFVHASKQNSPPGFYYYPSPSSGRRKLAIPSIQHFLKFLINKFIVEWGKTQKRNLTVFMVLIIWPSSTWKFLFVSGFN